MKTILSVVGARPNFVKLAALHRAWQAYPQVRHCVVHTGQHQDRQMSAVFFESLGLPAPHYQLSTGGMSPTQQLAAMLQGLAPILVKEQPDWVVVVGDTTSTLAGALAAAQAGIPLAHVEAGLRSGDRTMPEEINRIVCDQVASIHLVTEPAGVANLLREGVPSERIHLVGNCMIDTLFHQQAQPAYARLQQSIPGPYVVWTLHRPANVDTPAAWQRWLDVLEQIGAEQRVVWPLHPRSRQRLEAFGLQTRLANCQNLEIINPLGYLEFIHLMAHATAVITDSGGIQEETTALGVPCITLRPNTERPITVEQGTNELAPGADAVTLLEYLRIIRSGHWKKGRLPEYWDGHAAERIAGVLLGAD